MYSQEANHLPDDDRRRIRRTQRAYTELWTTVVTETRDDLSHDSARVAVHAAFGLLNAVADFASPLPDEELAELLRVMALRGLAPPT